MCGDQTVEAYSRVGRTKVLYAVLFACWEAGLMFASKEGHGRVCFFRDSFYMLTPGKVVAYGDSQVF